MRRKLLEDFLINKLYGYYLILNGNEHYFASKILFLFCRIIVAFLVFTHLIPPRIGPQ